MDVPICRAVDQNGKTIDFFLSKRRDVAAAKTFFRKALRKHGDPLSITLDADAASHRAVQELKDNGEIFYQKMRIWSCAYLNNIVEQDHRRVKRRINPMLGFKSFENARVVIAGIEFVQKITKGQYDLRRLGGGQASHAQMWRRVMAARIPARCISHHILVRRREAQSACPCAAAHTDGSVPRLRRRPELSRTQTSHSHICSVS